MPGQRFCGMFKRCSCLKKEHFFILISMFFLERGVTMSLRWNAFVVLGTDGKAIRGKDGLPGQHPRDRERLYALVQDHTVIVGKKAASEIAGNGFSFSHTIIVGGDKHLERAGVSTAPRLAVAKMGIRRNETDVFVIGGSDTYRRSFEFIDRIYVYVDTTLPGNAGIFPSYDERLWRELECWKGRRTIYRVLEKG